MNFLNDSLKTLKSVLTEGLDELDGSSAGPGAAEGDVQTNLDHENLRKLCQHQSDEVNKRFFHYCAVSPCRVLTHDFISITKG